jgi:hypothetical protein
VYNYKKDESKEAKVNNDIDYKFGDYNEELINKVAAALGDSFIPYFRKTGVTFFGSMGRILKIVKKHKILEIEFNVPVSNAPDVEILTEKQAREKKMGTCRWIYRGESLPEDLLREAKTNYQKLFG